MVIFVILLFPTLRCNNSNNNTITENQYLLVLLSQDCYKQFLHINFLNLHNNSMAQGDKLVMGEKTVALEPNPISPLVS